MDYPSGLSITPRDIPRSNCPYTLVNLKKVDHGSQTSDQGENRPEEETLPQVR